MSTAAPEAESTGALGMTTIEKMARAIEPLAWARLGLHDTHVAADRRARSLTQAKAALQALREPGEGAIEAMAEYDRPGIQGEHMGAAFTAAIDHILGERA